MSVPKVVLDTNVIVSALRSQTGASYRLVSLLGSGRFETFCSLALACEYEDVCRRLTHVSFAEVTDYLDFIMRNSIPQRVFYLWRAMMTDRDDEMVLEAAVAAGADYIVTYNLADFTVSGQFGIQPVPPREFLRLIGEIP